MDSISVHAADADKRAVGRLLRVALTGSVALAVVLLVLLALATGNTGLLEQRYPDLLTLTLAVAGALAILVLELLRRLNDRFEQVIVITHIEQVREGLDRLLQVRFDEARGCSVVSGVSASSGVDEVAAASPPSAAPLPLEV